MQQLGTPGTGSFSFGSPEDIAAEYRIEGRFVLDDALVEGGTEPFALPSGLGMFGRPGKLLLNTVETEDGGHVCYPGREVEEIELELPPGATVQRLPHAVDAHEGGASYTRAVPGRGRGDPCPAGVRRADDARALFGGGIRAHARGAPHGAA